MPSIGPSTIASSFERLLILPGGGGDGTNLIELTDGDAGATFALKISTTSIGVDTTDKIYLDGGSDTYITNSSNGVIELLSEGKTLLSLTKGATSYTRWDADDLLLIGNDDNAGTNLSLNGDTGISAFAEYPDGNYRDSGNNALRFLVSGKAGFETTKGARGGLIAPGEDPYGVFLTTGWHETAGWATRFGFIKHTDTSGTGRIGAFGAYGSGADNITRLFMGQNYNEAPYIILDMSSGYAGINQDSPDAQLHVTAGEISNTAPVCILESTEAAVDANDTILRLDWSADANVHDANDCKFISLHDSGGEIGFLETDSDGQIKTTFTQVSDERLKKDIVDTSLNGLNICNQIKIRDFKWNNERAHVENKQVIGGFIANELYTVYPYATTGTPGATKTEVTQKAQVELRDEDGNIFQEKKDEISETVIDPMGVTEGNLISVMLKAIQELSAKVTALENA